ncbi:hypothetical protein Nepgr_008188 [Nepenthes gracilis]|uniref:BSD domain-containing protein n=1 Tax=Nepenthes gracilis TaxID=150966 RepID=A0AAD3S892_NEPGR|nr:hypothetical protein Nepgr_008188 [Nepenthes gracilis]
MSWLVSSIASSLKLDDDDQGTTRTAVTTTISRGEQLPLDQESVQKQSHNRQGDSFSSISQTDQTISRRGVKEDLSEISKTLSRQLWGVASFLAPPSKISDNDPYINQPLDQSDESGLSAGESAGIAGIRHDLSEFGGKFRTGISKLSNHKAVSEFTKIASNLLQFGSEEDESLEYYAQRGVVGVTEEVVSFARDIAMHPETWLDFPLPDEEDEYEDDFDMSDAQQEHALAVERLVQRLASLRIELCPGYMSEGSFWKIYFVLVHPRLSRNDAEVLSTPQIVKARMTLTQELKNRAMSRPDDPMMGTASVHTTNSARDIPLNDELKVEQIEISALDSTASSEAANILTDKHPVLSTEIPIIDKEVTNEVPINKTNNETSTITTSKGEEPEHEDDGDEWLEEENEEIAQVTGTPIPLGNDEDVSFSDLEDDDDDNSASKVSKDHSL